MNKVKSEYRFNSQAWFSTRVGKFAVAVCIAIGYWVPLAQAQQQSTGSGPVPRVINGKPADDGAYPFMGALLYKGPEKAGFNQLCGATLIHPQYMLTAAHCVTDWFGDIVPPEYLEVLLGQNKLNDKPGLKIAVQGIIRHPNYSPYALEPDFALLKLATAVTLPTVKLAASEDLFGFQSGSAVTVIGWGMMDPVLPVLPNALQVATMPLVSDAECTKTIGRWFQPDTMLCAGKHESSPGAGDGIDSCFGDSGGPLLYQNGNKLLQVGVVSWGLSSECNDPKSYGVYSRVSAFRDWIYSFPAVPPRPRLSPKISGTPEVGQSLKTTEGVWYGDPATAVTYQWYRTLAQEAQESWSPERLPIAGANNSSYTLTKADLEFVLSVEVTRGNSGGKASQFSAFTDEIKETEVEIEVTPTPSPSPIEEQFDTNAPTTKLLGTNCKAKQCSILVQVQDQDYSLGIRAVEAKVVVFQVRKSVQHRVAQFKIQAEQVEGAVWKFSMLGNRGTKYKLLVTATDSAGNVQSKPLRVLAKNR